MNTNKNLEVLRKVFEKTINKELNEPEGVDGDPFFKSLIEIMNEDYFNNLPFELEFDKH